MFDYLPSKQIASVANRILLSTRIFLSLATAGVGVSHAVSAATADEQLAGGLQVRFFTQNEESTTAKDVTLSPNLSLYVPVDKSPTPFLKPEPFIAVWEGFVTVDIRSSYAFRAELSGQFQLEVNGNPVLEVTGTGGSAAPSKLVRLGKGPNRIAATFRSPPTGDAWLRVQWIPRNGLPAPIPPSTLSHMPAPELASFSALRRGRTLFLNYRCASCHSHPDTKQSVPELEMDAPSLEGIGSRLTQFWMQRWILDSRSNRPSARMPKMFQGEDALKNASAIAAYLATLTNLENTPTLAPQSAEDMRAGETLFTQLHCAGCHVSPGNSVIEPKLLSLSHVAQKFQPGELKVFLQNPETHYKWIRMPNFNLTESEAGQLAAFLQSHGENRSSESEDKIPALIERGKELVQTTGCLNCHRLNVENRFASKRLADIQSADWGNGCMAEKTSARNGAPFFALNQEEIQALRAFGKSGPTSLERSVPTAFANRQIENLRCAACHTPPLEGIPPLEILGNKLRPEWMELFLSGRVPYKPRTWIPARMPSFPAYAQGLSHGMAMAHGFPGETPREPDIDRNASETGRRLVAAEGGLSCISCHSIANITATAIVESPGINFEYVTQRLQKSYFTRWILNPLGIDPTSKMPVYFDEQGGSPLIDFYDGNGAQQIHALWEYMRLGPEMPPPPGLSPAHGLQSVD